MDNLKYILILTLLSVGIGLIFCKPPKFGEEKFDERQLIERGRAANLAMSTALVYLILVYGAVEFGLIPAESMTLLMVFGLVLAIGTYDGMCIMRGAYLGCDEDENSKIFVNLGTGFLWVILVFFNKGRQGNTVWLNLLVGIRWLLPGCFLMIRKVICCLKRNQDED